MVRLEELLIEAGRLRARLSNPRELHSAEETARLIGQFIALEHEMQWLPGAANQLKQLILMPFESGKSNHAFMAGLVLARWSPAGAGSALLDAARFADGWSSNMARLNLRWLAPTQENSDVLIKAVRVVPNDPVPRHVLVEALAHQRNATALPLIGDYLSGRDDPANRSWVLASVVALVRDDGLRFAADLTSETSNAVGATAIGVRAAYGDGDAIERLQQICRGQGANWHTALYWAGRIPHPSLIHVQIDGLCHPDAAVRADLVNSLVLVGSPEALRAAVGALDDPDPVVIDNATSHVAQLLGPAFDAQEWEWSDDGRLNQASRTLLQQDVRAQVDELATDMRYLFGQPLVPHALIDLLYIGFLPSHTWVNFIATTAAAVSYSPHMDALGNLESIHRLEEWFAAKGSSFVPGAWYYSGSPV